MKVKEKSILPGFGITMGITLLYLSVIVLIPLSALLIKASGAGWGQFWSTLSDARVLASFRVSLSTSLAAAAVNMVFGFVVAWVLVRYSFPGKRWIDGIIDLPFALPTAVAGISLTALYSQNGWIGRFLEPLGVKVAYTPIGITVALIFIGLPFVVRTVQPVLQELQKDIEEAAVSLGASRWLTFRRVLLPELIPPLLTGFTLALSRSIGEYGSVVFISGNMPMRTEIVPLLIMTKLEQYDYTGAAVVATAMLVLSFLLLLVINVLQWHTHRRFTSK